jgi:hypothetical protein
VGESFCEQLCRFHERLYHALHRPRICFIVIQFRIFKNVDTVAPTGIRHTFINETEQLPVILDLPILVLNKADDEPITGNNVSP